MHKIIHKKNSAQEKLRKKIVHKKNPRNKWCIKNKNKKTNSAQNSLAKKNGAQKKFAKKIVHKKNQRKK